MERALAFERDPYLTELETSVVATGLEDVRPFTVLADTLFFPEGGGQPADRGWLGESAVLDVQRRGSEIRHYLSAPAPEGPAVLRLDWERRFDHMQQHSGQHLLTAVAQDRLAWATTAFHLGERVSDVELGVPALSRVELDRLEEAVAAEIRAARPVTVRHVSRAALGGLSVRSRGLPEDHEGDVRLVEIEGVDLNTCGGTHVRSTAELETVKLLGTEALRGGTRVFFVAGRRARRLLGEHEARAARLRALLGAPDEELPRTTEARLEQLRETDRQLRALEGELVAALVLNLSARGTALVEAHLEGKGMAFLQLVARSFAAGRHDKLALLTADDGGSAYFALAAGEGRRVDVQAAGQRVAALLDGKGGGSRRVYQGKTGSLAGRSRALEALAEL